MNTIVAALAALALAGVGVAKGTWAVGGSDSSCYALMADAFAHGRWQPASALATDAPWPDASRTLAPGGFIPSPVRPEAASPICAPGMSVLMAPLVAIWGPDGLFALSPIAGAALVWCAFLLARRMGGGAAGSMAAILTAASPIVLFQVVQPMNDVVTAALWLAALALVTSERRGGSLDPPRAPSVAGLLTGLAILVRPNLAPLALVVFGTALFLDRVHARRTAVALAFGALPGIAVLLVLNQVLYGRVLGSGYGDASTLFGAGYVPDNVVNFVRRVYETQTPFPLLALLAPPVLAGRARHIAWSLLGAAAIVVGFYLFYRPYPEWWYLRFQLPAVVCLVVLASAVAAHLARQARMGGVIAIVTVVLAIAGTRAAGARQAFDLQRLEGRYRDTAALVHDRLPDNAVLITVWQSGGMRFHAGREAVLWDSLDPAWLDRAIDWLRESGRAPYLLLERREEAEFRSRFRETATLGALDWPPRFDLARQVRIYDPADRARYLSGESYATDNIRPPGR